MNSWISKKFGIVLGSQQWDIGGLRQSFLAILGSIWLIIEFSSQYIQALKTWLDTYGIGVVVGAMVVSAVGTLLKNWPKTVYAHKLKERDVTIEMRVADVFKMSASLVVPVNTFFDNDLAGKVLKTSSIQSQFIRKYYAGETKDLDLAVNKQLSNSNYPYKTTVNKTLGKRKEYEIGTTIQIERQNRLFYLVALTRLNEEGRALGSLQNLHDALPMLWEFIRTRGDVGHVVMPVIGSSKARLPVTREKIIHYIVQSFIASCVQATYCNKLTIAIYPDDITQEHINLSALDKYLAHLCKYTLDCCGACLDRLAGGVATLHQIVLSDLAFWLVEEEVLRACDGCGCLSWPVVSVGQTDSLLFDDRPLKPRRSHVR